MEARIDVLFDVSNRIQTLRFVEPPNIFNHANSLKMEALDCCFVEPVLLFVDNDILVHRDDDGDDDGDESDDDNHKRA